MVPASGAPCSRDDGWHRPEGRAERQCLGGSGRMPQDPVVRGDPDQGAEHVVPHGDGLRAGSHSGQPLARDGVTGVLTPERVDPDVDVDEDHRGSFSPRPAPAGPVQDVDQRLVSRPSRHRERGRAPACLALAMAREHLPQRILQHRGDRAMPSSRGGLGLPEEVVVDRHGRSDRSVITSQPCIVMPPRGLARLGRPAVRPPLRHGDEHPSTR